MLITKRYISFGFGKMDMQKKEIIKTDNESFITLPLSSKFSQVPHGTLSRDYQRPEDRIRFPSKSLIKNLFKRLTSWTN